MIFESLGLALKQNNNKNSNATGHTLTAGRVGTEIVEPI